MSTNYPFKHTEIKWQNLWKQHNCFKVNLENTDKAKNYYVLEMLPYPSGKIHMGHVRNYALGDVLARYKRAKGFNVLYPMGWDAFGLPAENAAKENNVHPKQWTEQNIKDMKSQLESLGFSWDWSRELATNSTEYTKIEQQIFLDLFKHNLAYRKNGWVNWDPVENTVLANEQVIDGKGWRSGATVIQKQLNQWFLKITHFAEELLQDLTLLTGWSDIVKNAQKSWIGKSTGANIKFITTNNSTLTVYTTKPHTLFGASFIALSIRNELSLKLAENNAEIKNFIKKYNSIKNIEEELKNLDKEGINTNLYAINPVNNQQIPIYIANYVLDYGNGAIFGCPAHDMRDYEFATKYNLPILNVIQSPQNITTHCYEGDGVMINSSFLNNLTSQEAFNIIIDYLEKHNYGHKKTQYKLKDWGISRQRYWGTPIPIIYCKTCGVVPEKLENLPILLPDDVDFSSTNNPLENHPTFKHCKCPICNENATRDTDTLDTFMESSWYFINYITCNTNKNSFDTTLLNSFLPVDQYIGGIDHAIMHLLYARFIFKALANMGYINKNLQEPFSNLLTQGMITHKTYKTKDSNKWVFPNNITTINGKLIDTESKEEVITGKIEKMSKSKKNIVDPLVMCKTYGADAIRLFILSDSPPERGLEWNESGLEPSYKFINKVWRLYNKWSVDCINNNTNINISTLTDTELQFYIKIQQYIYNIEEYTKSLHFNKTVSLCRELLNLIEEFNFSHNLDLLKYCSSVFLQLINPIIPHITEELWNRMGFKNFIANTLYPTYNSQYLQLQNIEIAIQINGKTKGSINTNNNVSQEELLKQIMNIENINKLLINKPFKKVIYVPKKIINVVV